MTQWKIIFSHKAAKQAEKLKQSTLSVLRLLTEDLTQKGPLLITWPNYGKLYGRKNEYKWHCHLSKGRPTYVCCWKLINNQKRTIEIYYVGTHENAPY